MNLRTALISSPVITASNSAETWPLFAFPRQSLNLTLLVYSILVDYRQPPWRHFRQFRASERHLILPPCSNTDSAFPQTSFRRSEEHTSELQSRPHLVCRLLLEKKKQLNT